MVDSEGGGNGGRPPRPELSSTLKPSGGGGMKSALRIGGGSGEKAKQGPKAPSAAGQLRMRPSSLSFAQVCMGVMRARILPRSSRYTSSAASSECIVGMLRTLRMFLLLKLIVQVLPVPPCCTTLLLHCATAALFRLHCAD